MRHAKNTKIVKALRILESMTIDNDDTIIKNDSNSFTNGLNNKSLENPKK